MFWRIPQGTRVTAAYEVYFATIEYAEISPGETEITVMTECTEAGTIGNDFAAGELMTLVDPIGFIKNASFSRGWCMLTLSPNGCNSKICEIICFTKDVID
ncbi:MAG: baseplate J/gp47 family protein [Lachnospiraceae bacterium]|nr:baseplate J/gp47 family protein [Lachnospiraceae bacterium]